ncbi:MAG: hypothetical protein ACRD0W_05755 [Acidimicrobiales bacterium]
MSDTRVVYGATCSWWGVIGEVASTLRGLPCCPSCSGVLLEVGSVADWWAGVDRYQADGHAGYRAFIEWLRGRCFRGSRDLAAVRVAASFYELATGRESGL